MQKYIDLFYQMVSLRVLTNHTLTVKPAPTKTELTYTLTDTTYNKTQ